MDARNFDALARTLSITDSRRRLLALVATLPLFAGLLGILSPEDAEGKGRRKRRKKRHKHGKGGGKHPRKCHPRAKSVTCAGVCGSVTNNCKKTVDCGSCNCPAPCGDCKICQSGPNSPGECVPDPDQVGDACGGDGQICQPDGACACETGSCANPTPICDAGGVCVGCGADGECAAAGAGDLCCAGTCFTGICCNEIDCTTAEAPDCVGHDCVCAANGNAACAAGLTCCAAGCVDVDTDPANCGSCGGGPCSGVTPICAGGSCEACSTTNLCPSGECCAGDGSCVAPGPDGCRQADGSCGVCLVFVTSTISNAVLGGLAGADDHCQDLATTAGLPGSYKAWLSTAGNASPANRFVHPTTPYVLVDGVTQVADNWNDLIDGSLDHAINMDQNGTTVAESIVWTATLPNGNAAGGTDCSGWMATSGNGFEGNSNFTNTEWTNYGQGSCEFADRRLYCFQQT